MNVTKRAVRRIVHLLALCALPTAAVFSPNALADTVIYSNLGPGDSFQNSSVTWGLLNSPAIPPTSNPGYRTIGAKFVVPGAQTLPLTSIDAAMLLRCTLISLPGPCDTVNPPSATYGVFMTILSDNAGVPGAVLGTSAGTSVGIANSIYSFAFPTPVSLSAGSTYWLRADVELGIGLAGWNWNDQGVLGVGAWGNSGSSTAYTGFLATSAAPAFRAISAVPEPATIAMLSAGILLVAAARHRAAARRG